ncbi:MAG: uroporphyrinogen-III C-methyltransferase [Chloroflexi bacterium]|nr:uroporphyrinogen-III C-methyltransferase [Chloroflexota bacterium]MYD48982.1 uroporphyrinogen-III C-methyltransferase [Chloroflexota bacterium]
MKSGKVYLVGAGPGDPGLLTVKGARALVEADVVVYDRLLDPSLIELAPSSAERVFVGKERGRQALTQAEINDLVVAQGLAGKMVVRLKGGDPFVFGRGGEEAQALASAGVAFEVVPGVTSAVAAAAYAGIPVTHRGMSTSVTIVTGSEDPTKGETSTDWTALAKTGGTLVVLMGWATLPGIVTTLQANGMASDTPVALVQWGTWSRQRAVMGTLSDIVERGKTAGIGAPVIAIIGKVATLREEIGWFDRRPLLGKRVLVTRSRTQASRLIELLTELGAEPIELPSIEIGPLDDYSELGRALADTADVPGRWVIFSSVNSVEYVWDRLRLMGMDARYFSGATIGAIGPATAQSLRQRGIEPDFVPKRSVSEEVIAELSGRDWTGRLVVLPGSAIGRDALATGLSGLGADVRRVPAYRNVRPEGVAERARAAFAEGIDVVTFTSSSTVRNLVDILGDDRSLLDGCVIACIGPITAGTANELGLSVDVVAAEHNVEGLAEALVGYFAANADAAAAED